MKLLASTGVAAALLAAFGMTCLPTTAAAQNYTWNTAKIGGTGYITGMFAHPSQAGLFYAKTDVGGAYRYNAATSTWIPLTDWLPPSLGYAKGIDSLALDPRDPSKVYIMGGGGYNDGPAIFMASSNQGQSFTTVPMQFSAGGNASGRQAGEKLQVDPNNSNILFYGTANTRVNAANNGLWKSTDGGQHWNRLSNFNALTSDDTGAGVAFIAFSKDSTSVGNPTPVIYVGVNTQSAADNGISVYKSGDGGNTWSRLWGGPTAGAFPQRGQIGPDGYLYITYSRADNYNDGHGNQYGPGGLIGGEVWKLNVQYGQDQWTNITPRGPWTPNGYGFSGLSVDPTNKGWLTVNTIDWYASPGETMYRSTDGGATWTDVLAKSTLDPSLEPWRTSNNPITNFGNWGNSILDPNDINHAFVSWAGGIWETHNLTASSTRWQFGENGVAETAILDLKSPVANEWNAYPVLAGAGDVCGFTIMDVNAYPQFPIKGPDSCKDTWALDFAKTNSKLVVRVGDDWASTNRKFGGVSFNGGYSWSAFGSNGTTQSGGGFVAMSQDSRNPNNVVNSIIWSTWDAPTVRSTDMGNSWVSTGLPKSVLLASDGADPTVFYAYDRQPGTIYLSNSNGTSWWAASAAGVPTWADKLVTPTGVAGDIWLVSSTTGLYHNGNWGLSAWDHLSTVSAAKALGFGKAAPGASYPTMYLSGTVGGVQGVFRSSDKGLNWVRIDTSQHQLGASTVLTGDPKVFGTVYVGDGGRGIAVGTSTN